MKMLRRLRYLLDEGFEVASLSAYDPRDREASHGTASLTWVEIDNAGRRRLRTEHFQATRDETRQCASLFHQLR